MELDARAGAALLEGEVPEAQPSLEEETAEGLKRKLKNLSFFSHSVAVGSTETALQPVNMDPGIYDGEEKFELASTLQTCLQTAMKGHGDVRAALVDLTKDKSAPEFAGVRHQQQEFAASVPKLAAMLAAFQLRHDLRVAFNLKGSKSLADYFSNVRDDWAGTRQEKKGSAASFTKDIALRGHLVASGVGGKSELDTEDKSPRLESIFAPVAAGAPVHIEFAMTGRIPAGWTSWFTISKAKTQRPATMQGRNWRRSAFWSGCAFLGGLVPASNFITSTLVRDIGYPYIASTLLQSGLYDPARGGGIWLGHSYWGAHWRALCPAGPRRARPPAARRL